MMSKKRGVLQRVAVATKHTVRTHENNAVNRLLNSELIRIVQIISSVKNTTDVRV